MRIFLIVALILTALFTAVSAGQELSAFQQAQKLEKEGESDDAFLKYLSVPGGEYAAMRLARHDPAAFLKTLRTKADGPPAPRLKLIEGDLLLAMGKKKEALACYRAVTAKIACKPSQGWNDGLMPADYYPVEPPGNAGRYQPAQPFALGPGSHRDNWLIRRFIALDDHDGALDDAAAEFARIWKLHRQKTKPYIAPTHVYDATAGQTKQQQRLFRPAGFNGFGLQFAIDYAYFLKRRKQLDKSLAILTDPMKFIDMDRNPNGTSKSEPVPEDAAKKYPVLAATPIFARPFWYHGGSSGISRKEFIRLAYGAFKAAGKEQQLVNMLQEQIDQGNNAAQRSLAQVRFHQGNDADALALELEYIDCGEFNKISTAYRRGLAYEASRKNAEAATELERVLKLPVEPFDLPDADEEATQQEMMSSMPRFLHNRGGGSKTEVLQRLNRLYTALGKTDKVAENALRRFQLDSPAIRNLPALEEAATRMRRVGREKEFIAWARKQIDATEDHIARANLYWCLREHETCIRELGLAIKEAKDRADAEHWTGFPGFGGWCERFRKRGKDQFRVFLSEVVEHDPQNVRARLELLDLQDQFGGDAAIALLEGLLESDARHVFGNSRRIRNHTRFRNYYDLAYRLMRLYEKQADNAKTDEKILRLAMRILRGEKPFARKENASPLPNPRANWHAWSGEEYLQNLFDCMDVMLAHATRPADLEKIAAIVDASDCVPLKNQLRKLLPNRRRIDPSEVHRRQYKRVAVEWPKLPDGVRLLTHRDDVRAIAPDGRWIGGSWGLVRYETDADNCLDILQIPIGVRVVTFCDTPAGLFVGTRGGLFRIDEPDAANPQLVRIDLESVKRKSDDSYRSDRALYTEQLLWWNDALWVRDGDLVFRYDPVKKVARNFGRVPGKLFPAAGTLWAGNHVLNPRTGEFDSMLGEGRQWQLIGATRDEIWADVYINNELRHRPALLDPQTHALRVLPIEQGIGEKDRCVNGTFRILAEDRDHVWLLGDGSHLTVYDRATGKLRQLAQTYEGSSTPDKKNVGPAVWQAYNDGGRFCRFFCGSGARQYVPDLNLQGDRGPYFCWQELPKHRLFLGSGIVREWREDNLGYDDNDGMSHHIQDLEGGLFEIDTRTLRWKKLGSRAGELTDFYVKKIVFDDRDRKAYVCTNGGVTILGLPDYEVAGRITVSDGLPSNKVEDVARIGDKLYMACELGDEDGGLAVLDLKSGLIQRLTMSDGLKSDKIKRLRVDRTDLHILYGTIYGVRARNTSQNDSVQAKGGDDRIRTFTSSILDTKTGKLRDGKEVLPASRPPDEKNRLPYLGGAVLCDVTHDGKRLIGGTHGLVLLEPDAETKEQLPFPVEPVKPVFSLHQQQLAEAAKIVVPRSISLEQLEKYLDHENPFVRANALARVMTPVTGGNTAYTPLLAEHVADPCRRVRSTVVWLLSRAKDNAAVAPLQRAMDDRDHYIRAVAALGLAKHGVAPPQARFEEMLKRENRYGNYPFGAASSIGVEVGTEKIYEAMAPHVNRAMIELMMKYPLSADDYEPRQKILATIGRSIRKHPDAAAALLKAYDHDRHSWGQVRFAQAVFGYTGKAMLPMLHRALKNKDRVIRSNAARACGTIGDPASIAPLIQSLDLESGYSRASIVWALGKLKAEDALPQLAKLYVDARNDEHRRRGSGFRMAQSQAAMQSHYDTFRNLDALGSEWNELKQAARPKPIDPRRNEELLSPQGILEAVRMIGPTASQPFYRSIAGEKDSDARREAAQQLAQCGPDDIKQNVTILRNLLGDSDHQVSAAAAVSLLILDQTTSREPIRQWLSSPEDWQKRILLREFHRIQNRERLAFARNEIRRIAGDPSAHRETRNAAQSVVDKLF